MGVLKTVRRTLADPRVKRSVWRILRENVLCSMATIGREERVHINTAYFCVSRDLELFFLSDPESRHCTNLERDPSMAMTVFRSTQAWGTSNRGLQLFGTCEKAEGAHGAEAMRLYGRRFPLYRATLRGTTRAQKREASGLRSYRFYRFVPRELKVLDEREFGGGVFVVASVPRSR